MEGIHFVTDAKGRKIAVQIDLEKYGREWQDFYDALTLERRRRDKRVPLAVVKKRLVKAGKLSG